MENNNTYLSTEQFAKALGVTPQYIRKLAKEEKIPASIIGKNWVFDKSLLQDKQIIFKYKKDVDDQIRKNDTIPTHVALSFFTGAMGLDLGIEYSSFEFLIASEIDPVARKTILANRPNIGLIGDINNYSASEIKKYANIPEDIDVDLMVGGPPCQAFSTAGKREGFGDKRGNVFLVFLDRILEIKPKIAVIENVRGLLSAPFQIEYFDKKGIGLPPKTPRELKGQALLHIIRTLEQGGYGVSFELYNAANFGAPQKRERVVMVCTRDGKTAPYLNPTNSENGEYGLQKWKTVREAFYGLDESTMDFIPFPEKRLKYFRMLKPGQYWKNLPLEYQEEAMGDKLKLGGGKTGFFRRLDWDQASPTLVTDPTMPATDLCHPELDRPLSIQEYKRIQEFPDDWIICGSIKDKYRQIGNAVPISLGKAIGILVKKILNNENANPSIIGFKYSRYTNTNNNTFIEYMNEKGKKNAI